MAAHPNDFGVLDAFTRANTGPPAGPGWANVGHWGDPVGYITTGNQMAASGGGWRADHWVATYSRAAGAVAFGITIATVGSGDAYYFLFSDHAAMKGYALKISGTSWELGVFNGSFDDLAVATQALAAGDGICLIADDDTHLTAWHRTAGTWTKKADVVDTTYGGALYPGISSASSARWDDMFGGLPTGGPVDTTITAPFLSAGTQVFAPTLENAAAQEIVAPFLPSQTQTYAPTLTNASEPEPDPTTITAPFLPSAEQGYAPTLTNAAAQDLAAPFLPAQTQTWPPSLTNAGTPETTIVAPFLAAGTRTFPPILTTTRSPAAPPVYPRPVEETIILRGEGGQWMVVGQGAARGIVHEGLSLSADRAGPSTCSFTLKRDPGQSWPDLSPFNECIIEIGGVRVWSGRMREAPGQSGASNTISFTGSGCQSHLDDDLLSMGWVHTRIGDWQDASALPGMTQVKAGLGSMSSEGGDMLIGCGPGVTLPSGTYVARATLDLGEHNPRPGGYASITFSMDPVQALTEIYLHGHDQQATDAGGINMGAASTWNMTTGVKVTIGGTMSRGTRYVSISVFRPALGNASTGASPHMFKIHRAAITRDSGGYPSGCPASTVIRDVVASGSLPRLSRDTSRIFTSGFAIPDYWPQGFQSPRELMEPVNAFHDWHLGVDVDRRVFFEPPSDIPTVEIGEWSGAEFTDASAGSGEDVYSKVIVQAQDSAGQPLEVIRTAATAVPELAVRVPLDAAIANPSFEADTAGWTLTRMTRSNTQAGHGTWSIRHDGNVSGGGGIATTTITGLSPGVPHLLTWWDYGASGGASQVIATITGPAGQEGTITVGGTGAGAAHSLVWVPRGETATLRFDVDTEAMPGGGLYIYLDDVRVSRLEVNAVDRHRFARAQRLPIGAPLSPAAAEVIGDIWLRNHIRTPLKGSVSVTGQGGVREVIGGAPVHPAHLLLRAGECIRHAGMADPDTGAWGRVGRIASVSYTGGRATIEIDNERHAFDALVGRYAALAGQVR